MLLVFLLAGSPLIVALGLFIYERIQIRRIETRNRGKVLEFRKRGK